MNADEFRKYGREMVDYVANYLEGGVNEYPPSPLVDMGYMRSLISQDAPNQPDRYEDVMKDFEQIVVPGMTHWQSSHFHAYYPIATSYPSLLAELLASGIANMGFNWASSPANTELEVIVLDWLAKMLGLPDHFMSSGPGGGVIQSSASEAFVVSLIAARTKAVEAFRGKVTHITDHDIMSKLVVYCSDQAHFVIDQAVQIGAVRCHRIITDDHDSMRGDALQAAMAEDLEKGLLPFYVMATLGTTAVCAYDKIAEIGPICDARGVWLHIDAAYAGNAFVCPEFRYLLDGVQYATSFNCNMQKWMLMNVDCTAVWFKDFKYVTSSLGPPAIPEYCKSEEGHGMPDMMNLQIAMGGKFRALKIWFVIRTYGISGIQMCIRKAVGFARYFADLVESDDRFQVTNNVTLGLVCFRLKGHDNDDNKRLLTLIKEDHRIYIVGSISKNVYFLRFVVCSPRTEKKDIEFAWMVIQEIANKFLQEIKISIK